MPDQAVVIVGTPAYTDGSIQNLTMDAGGNLKIAMTGSVTSSENLAQVGGATVTVGAGNAAAGTQRVILASDQPVIPVNDPGLPDTLGQKTSANSTSVVLASDSAAPLPTGAATEATLAKIPVAQSSTTSGESGTLIQGAVVSGDQAYVAGNTNPLTLTTTGRLRVGLSSAGAIAGGTAGSNSDLMGAIYNSTPLTLTNAQQAGLQLDVNANLLVNDPGLPNTLGQSNKAGSTSVTLASDQGTLAVGGDVAAGAADSGNPVKTGGVYNSTLPVLTTGQRGDLQLDTSGELRTLFTAVSVSGADAQVNTAVGKFRSTGTDATSGYLGVYEYLFNGTTWDRIRSGGVTGMLGVVNQASPSGGYSFLNLAANATTTIKSGAGTLHTITINTLGTADTVTVYDNTAGSGTKIATINAALSQTTFTFDAAFATGLTVVIAGTTAPDITVTYK